MLTLNLKIRPRDAKSRLIANTLMLGKTGQKEKDSESMRWLNGIIDSMDMSLSILQETGKDLEAWHDAIHAVPKTWIRLSNDNSLYIFHHSAFTEEK